MTSGRTSSILIEIEDVRRKREVEEGRIRQEEKECPETKRKQRAYLTQEEEERAQNNAFEAEEAQLETDEANDLGSHRMRTKRGEKLGDSNKQTLSQQGQCSAFGSSSVSVAPVLGAGFEPVVPLEMSANRRVPTSAVRKVPSDVYTPEMVHRKVTALLTKLTMERFDSISDQIIQWANKSVNEKDGRTLIQVVRLTFEKAVDEAALSEIYARLCRKMMEQISPDVQDDGIKNQDGMPIAGGQLFRKYLLHRCQEDFERGWFTKEATAVVTANKKKGTEEAELYSDESYPAQKARRQALGLIKFIGELFKLQMLTERIMHECVKKLLGNVENPEEEEIESLCQLLTTAGQLLDTPKARAHMDVYFTRMKELGKSTNVSLRMQFMLQVCNESWLLNHCTRSPL
jgi:translation initiation factor 4G